MSDHCALGTLGADLVFPAIRGSPTMASNEFARPRRLTERGAGRAGRAFHLLCEIVSVKLMTAAWAVDLPISEKLVLLALADAANDEGICWPSVTSLYQKCSLSERAVRHAVGMLKIKGHLTIHERAGKSNYYTINSLQALSPTPAAGAPQPLQDMHPCTECTPAAGAPTPAAGAGLSPSFSPPRAPPLNLPLSKNPHEPSVKSRAPKRARSRTVPDDFQVTEAMRAWAKTNCPEVDIEAETLKFRDHEYRDPHGNWPAAWRTWMRRSPDFKPRGNGGAAAAAKRTGSWRDGLEDSPHADK